MALRRPQLRRLRDPGNVLINIAVEQRHQRLNVKHIPADGQIALLQLRRERLQPGQLAVEILQNRGQRRIAAGCRQKTSHLIQLLDDRSRRRSMDGRNDQPIHLCQRPGIDRVCAIPIVKILNMPEIALVLIQRAEQFITLQVTTLTAFQHAAHALLQFIAAANNTGHQRQFLLRQRRGGEVRE